MSNKYPKACAYILGVYDVTPDMMFFIGHLEGCEELFCCLETEITKHHPRWVLYEMYYRGIDLAECIIDAELTKSKNIIKDLGKAIKKLGHHSQLVVLAHLIGKKYIQNNRIYQL